MADLNALIEKGETAQQAHEDLSDRFTLIRENIHSKWEATTAHEKDIREVLYHKLHALNELERSFFLDINAAKVAAHKLEAENARSKHN